MEVARGEHGGAWWLPAFSIMPLWFVAMLAVENSARVIRGYGAVGVPALLQTEDYARAARQAAHHPEPATEQVELAVRLVMERQSRTIDSGETKLWIILRDTALYHMPGGRDIQVDQLTHLIHLAKQPRIALRINGRGRGRYHPRGGSFTIYQGPGPVQVYVTELHRDSVFDDLADVDPFLAAHYRLDMSAESPERTIDVLSGIRDQISRW
jgi:hypothetical protein